MNTGKYKFQKLERDLTRQYYMNTRKQVFKIWLINSFKSNRPNDALVLKKSHRQNTVTKIKHCQFLNVLFIYKHSEDQKASVLDKFHQPYKHSEDQTALKITLRRFLTEKLQRLQIVFACTTEQNPIAEKENVDRQYEPWNRNVQKCYVHLQTALLRSSATLIFSGSSALRKFRSSLAKSSAILKKSSLIFSPVLLEVSNTCAFISSA